jgi:hypothetical protein
VLEFQNGQTVVTLLLLRLRAYPRFPFVDHQEHSRETELINSGSPPAIITLDVKINAEAGSWTTF